MISKNASIAAMVSVAFALTIGSGVAVAVAAQGNEPAPPVAEEVVEETLTDSGAPITPEFDPASQPQTSLLSAASQEGVPVTEEAPLGEGAPRAAVEAPEDAPAVGSPGCIPQYGEQGQCLPIVPPSLTEHAGHIDPDQLSLMWSCAEVRIYFPKGIALAGKEDPLNLDTNTDAVACGKKDQA